MSDELAGFAAPPFQPEEALPRLQRELHALGLNRRADAFELRGQEVARAALHDGMLQVAIAKRPARSPDWQARSLKSSGELRDFIAELKRRLAQWNNSDD